MQKRIPLTELAPGDYIYAIGTRKIEASFVALDTLANGAAVTGPRGGKYTLHQPMAAARGDITGKTVVVTSTGRPIVASNATATIEAPEEW